MLRKLLGKLGEIARESAREIDLSALIIELGEIALGKLEIAQESARESARDLSALIIEFWELLGKLTFLHLSLNWGGELLGKLSFCTYH